jgi:hypothetical protein
MDHSKIDNVNDNNPRLNPGAKSMVAETLSSVKQQMPTLEIGNNLKALSVAVGQTRNNQMTNLPSIKTDREIRPVF